ncbi:DUF945 family protein [Emcibacter nanhaiensis]|uniref:DUF945 domain-containing protein n=1 Tax=Emcibacter nanhaiensis TaxID=1505037 RepID=A0A501PAP7_9PROT|nr:DUF945 family protein [Emcibacter nanhaiensis]TPD57305.1 DUF945 domain-containing protein [Emcibacter nanhaiensis]
MNKKRIIWASVGIILIIIFALLPKFFGNLAHEKIEQQAATISEMPGYALTILEYDQGWFSSEALISYGLDQHTLEILEDSDDLDEADKFLLELFRHGARFRVNIAHGPVTFQNGIHFALLTLDSSLTEFEADAYQAFHESAGVDSFLEGTAAVSYFGTLSADVSSPAFTAEITPQKGPPATVKSGGFTSHTEFNADQTHYDLEALLKSFSLEAGDTVFDLQNIAVTASGDRLNDYIWLGTGSSTMERISVTAPDGGTVTIEGVDSTYTTDKMTEQTLSFDLKLSTGGISVSSKAPVPNDVTFSDIKLDAVIRNMDVAGLTEYVKGLSELEMDITGDMEQDQAVFEQKKKELISSAGLKLVLASPELEIRKLSLKFSDGNFAGVGLMNVNAEGLEKVDADLLPKILAQRLFLDSEVTFDQALAEQFTILGMKQQMAATGIDMSFMPPEQLQQAVSVQTSLMLQAYVQQGLITAGEEENTYQSRLQIRDGQQFINGRPIQLPQMPQ